MPAKKRTVRRRPRKKAARTRVHSEHEVLLDYLTKGSTSGAGDPRPGCNTCKMPKVSEAIGIYLASVKKDREEGRIPKSVEGFHRLLVRHYNYPLQRDALTNHMKRCLGESI